MSFESNILKVRDFVMTVCPEGMVCVDPSAPYTLGVVTRVDGPETYDIYVVGARVIQFKVHRDHLIHLTSLGPEGKHCDVYENAGRRVYWDGEVFRESKEACSKTYWNPAQTDRTNVAKVLGAIANLGTKEMRDLFLKNGWPIRDAQQHLLTLAAMKKFYRAQMLADVPVTLQGCTTATKNAQQTCTSLDSSCDVQEHECARLGGAWFHRWSGGGEKKKQACKEQVKQCRARAQDCRLVTTMPKHSQQLQQKLSDALACYARQDYADANNTSMQQATCMSLQDVKEETNFINSTCTNPMRLAAAAFAPSQQQQQQQKKK